jgi:hypothetical protein
VWLAISAVVGVEVCTHSNKTVDIVYWTATDRDENRDGMKQKKRDEKT